MRSHRSGPPALFYATLNVRCFQDVRGYHDSGNEIGKSRGTGRAEQACATIPLLLSGNVIVEDDPERDIPLRNQNHIPSL